MWQILPVDATTKKTKFTTRHQQAYIMAGTDFQTIMWHGVDAIGKRLTTSARLSFTFRVRSDGEWKQEWKPHFIYDFNLPIPIPLIDIINSYWNPTRLESLEQCTNVTWDEIFHEVSPFLTPDITKMMGQLFYNNGRMSCELIDGTHKPFQYKYGGMTHTSYPMGPNIQRMQTQLEGKSHRKFGWCHVVFYPFGTTKLGKHSDDEREIEPCTDIACITLMQDPLATRDIYVQGKQSVKRRRE